MKYADIFVHIMKHCYIIHTTEAQALYTYLLHMRVETRGEITSVVCGNRGKNGQLPSIWERYSYIFETKPLYEKRQINSGANNATCILL